MTRADRLCELLHSLGRLTASELAEALEIVDDLESARNQRNRVLAEQEFTREILSAFEWVDMGRFGKRCFLCHYHESQGHGPKCQLPIALGCSSTPTVP